MNDHALRLSIDLPELSFELLGLLESDFEEPSALDLRDPRCVVR